MKKARVLALVLALAMLLGVLAGCQKTGSDDKPSQPTSGAQNTPSGGIIDAEVDEEGNVIDPFWNLQDSDYIDVTVQDWKGGDVFTYTSKDTGAAKKTPENTIIIGGSGQADSLDPHGGEENANVYETLLKKDSETGEFIPWLATEWEYDADGNLHMTLRENVKFHDGNTLTSEDVLFSLERASSMPQNKGQATLLKIDYSASYAEDDTHLVLVMKQSSGSLLSFLSSPETGIMSKAFVEEKGEDYDFLSESGGTGPYFLTGTVTDMSQSFEAFPDYWGGEAAVKYVTFKVYDDLTAMMIDFENGAIDYTYANTLENVDRFVAGSVSDAVLARIPAAREGFLQLCQLGELSPFTDVRVRKALAHCIDYDALIEAIYGVGLADRAYSGWSPAMDGYIEAGLYEYNPELSKQLLEEAGYSMSNPCVVKAFVTSGSQKDTVCEIVQGFANEVGFDFQLEVVKSARGKELADVTKIPAEYHMRMINIYPGSGDTFEFYFNMLAGNGREEGTYSAFRAIPNEEWCVAVDTADSTTDLAVREEQLALAQQIMYDEVLTIPLYNFCDMHLYRDYVKGTEYLTGESMSWHSWYIEE